MFSNLYCEYNNYYERRTIVKVFKDITHSKHLRIVLGIENHVIQVVPSFLELRSPAHHSHVLTEVLEVRWGRLHYFFTPQYTPRRAQVN